MSSATGRLKLSLALGFVSFFLIAAWSQAQLRRSDHDTADNAGFKRYTVIVDGIEREYYVHVPSQLSAAQPAPVVLLLHGGGSTAMGTLKLCHLDATADKHGFVLVCPQAVKKHWNDGRGLRDQKANDGKFISLMLDKLESQLNIDHARIYATGISNGGFFSQYLAINLSDRIAAVVSVAATLSKALFDGPAPPQAVPIAYILGTEDPLVPYQGGFVQIGILKRGAICSADQSVAFWVKADGCKMQPVVEELPAIAPADGTKVALTTYGGGTKGAEVRLYTVHGGGHCLPRGLQYLPRRMIGVASKQLDANETIWGFVSKYRLQQQ